MNGTETEINGPFIDIFHCAFTLDETLVRKRLFQQNLIQGINMFYRLSLVYTLDEKKNKRHFLSLRKIHGR